MIAGCSSLATAKLVKRIVSYNKKSAYPFVCVRRIEKQMIARWMLTGLLSLSLTSCLGQQAAESHVQIEPIRIHRFDKALYQLISSTDTALEARLSQEYPQMLDILGKGVLNLRAWDTEGNFLKLRAYYGEPTLNKLYQDALHRYEEVGELEEGLHAAFTYLKGELPELQIPAVYMHVSGLNQNVLVGDSLLSLSIDKYLGADYPLYQEYFYASQRMRMTPAQVLPDYLMGWLMAEYPFSGNERVLLDRMVYEGKLRYTVSQALRLPDASSLLAYTPEVEKWCEANEAELWQLIVARKQLYTPDPLTTESYFDATASPFPGSEAPANIGSWIGYRIVKRYMEESGASLRQLWQTTDAQVILTAAKYKP